MSLQAYQRVAQRAESPRQTEYRLFGDVTRALMEVAEGADVAPAARIEALDWNRRLWSTLSNDCSRPDNALPNPVRAKIISLAIWVNRHTSAVIRGGAGVELLIEVNRAIMQGLMTQSEAA